MIRKGGKVVNPAQVEVANANVKKQPAVLAEAKNVAAANLAANKGQDLDPTKIWEEAFAKGGIEPGLVIATADFLFEMGKPEHVVEFLKANLRHGIVVRPWVYEALASRPGSDRWRPGRSSPRPAVGGRARPERRPGLPPGGPHHGRQQAVRSRPGVLPAGRPARADLGPVRTTTPWPTPTSARTRMPWNGRSASSSARIGRSTTPRCTCRPRRGCKSLAQTLQARDSAAARPTGSRLPCKRSSSAT